jgi:hypothetical protein
LFNHEFPNHAAKGLEALLKDAVPEPKKKKRALHHFYIDHAPEEYAEALDIAQDEEENQGKEGIVLQQEVALAQLKRLGPEYQAQLERRRDAEHDARRRQYEAALQAMKTSMLSKRDYGV